MDTPPEVYYDVYVIVPSQRVLPVPVFEFLIVVMQLIFNVNFWKTNHRVEAPYPDALFICQRRILKSQKSRNKSVLTENGLVSKFSSRPQSAVGATLHLHESETFENSYGIHQLSRFEILNNLQKDQKLVHIENMHQLRLAPPAIYHEKVKKGTKLLTGDSSNIEKIEKPSKNRQFRDLKLKGSSLRFPL